MKRPGVPLTLLLVLPIVLLTACTPSNNVTARVDSQGGQVSITAGSGNVVESKQNTADQVQKELDLKNKEIELAKKEAELANREKALAEQRLADVQREKLDKGSSSNQDTDNDGGSAPIVKPRRQTVRPRPQASCCEQSSYYSRPSYPTTQTAMPSYQPSSNYQPASSYQSVPSQSVSSYTTPSQPPVTRAEPVAEYSAEQNERSSNSYQREGINSGDDKPKKKSFWKKAWPWIAVGAGAAAGVAIAKRR